MSVFPRVVKIRLVTLKSTDPGFSLSSTSRPSVRPSGLPLASRFSETVRHACVVRVSRNNGRSCPVLGQETGSQARVQPKLVLDGLRGAWLEGLAHGSMSCEALDTRWDRLFDEVMDGSSS